MRTTSPAFSPYPDARWSKLRASFQLVDLGAAGDATASSDYSDTVSQIQQTHDGVEDMGAKYATLETGGWLLDGSYDIMPDNLSGVQTGWWSLPSLEDGTFIPNCTLTFAFDGDHSSIGFTVIFDKQTGAYPKIVSIAAYDADNVLIDTQTGECTGLIHQFFMPANNYRKIILSFSETQEPYQRVRVSEVVFGLFQRFDQDNITNASLSYGVSPTAENCESNGFEMTFDNTDKQYNMVNPDGIYQYLEQSQPIDVEIGVGDAPGAVEYVNMGRFYFEKSSADDNAMTAKIIAYDPFYQLEKTTCKLGGAGLWTADEAVKALIEECGLPITTDIPVIVGARQIAKAIPKDTKHREALRLIAQAAKCTCYFTREDVLKFIDIPIDDPVETLNNTNMTDPAKVSVSDLINTVVLTVKNDYVESEFTETASSALPGEVVRAIEIQNPLVYENDVADWLLAWYQKRVIYNIEERGNPAREIADTVTVYDAYGTHRTAVVVSETYDYDGTLSASSQAVG